MRIFLDLGGRKQNVWLLEEGNCFKYFSLKGAIIREIEVINPGAATIQGNIGTCTHCDIDK